MHQKEEEKVTKYCPECGQMICRSGRDLSHLPDETLAYYEGLLKVALEEAKDEPPRSRAEMIAIARAAQERIDRIMGR